MKRTEQRNSQESEDELRMQRQTRETISTDIINIDKLVFTTFMAEVINCSAQTKSRTERIRIIIRAAEKYLQAEGLTVEQVNEKLKMQITNSQDLCGGS